MVAAEGLTCMVRFRSPDKVERVVRLDDVRGPDLAGALPWRQFRWYRGQQHFSGFWWSLGLPRFDGQVDYAASRRGCGWICCSYSTGVR